MAHIVRRALFRLDAGRAIGLGHGLRCLALADELAARGWTCRFALNPGAAALLAAVAPFAHDSIEDEGFADPERLAKRAGEDWDLLVVDSYRLDAAFESRGRKLAKAVLVVDDLADRPHDADLLVDATAGRASADYAGLIPSAARVLVGPQHALLSSRFARARAETIPRRLAPKPAQTILVTLGGAPPSALLARLAGAARAAAPDAAIEVAAGVSDLADLGDPRARIHRGQIDMAALTAAADLCVGAGGGSSWERCCLGLPAVIVEIADNQRGIIDALAAAGAAIAAGRLEDLDDRALIAAIAAAAGDGRELARMAGNAALLCDGLGARRVANAAEALLDETAPRVTLRPASAADSDTMLAWQQTPGVRRFAKTPRAPERAEHEAWLTRRLGDPLAGPFEIIEADGAPAGVLRFDRTDGSGETYRVSILVAPERQGQGVAARALAAGGRLLAEATLEAEVLEANAASHRLFGRAGYRRVGPEAYRRDPLFT
jgi:UDP-2,4-diacetamido-2,4,6-trideoxy-beta-L-altropyranose hydrolase